MGEVKVMGAALMKPSNEKTKEGERRGTKGGK